MEARDLTTKMTAKLPKIARNCESSVRLVDVIGIEPVTALARKELEPSTVAQSAYSCCCCCIALHFPVASQCRMSSLLSGSSLGFAFEPSSSV